MPASKKDWIGADEAIETIMQRLGCSRRTARRKLAQRIKTKDIKIKYVPRNVQPLPPTEIGKLLDAGKQHEVLIGLGDFMQHFGLTWDETLVELQAGRLVAGTDESARLMSELGTGIPLNRFTVSVEAVEEWLHDPATPKHLIGRPQRQ